MFKQWIVSAALVASTFVASAAGAAAAPGDDSASGVTITPFKGQIVNWHTTRSYSDVIARLDAAINKTGSATFLSTWHASKTHEQQLQLIDGIVQDKTFLFFQETNHKAWLDVWYGTDHPGATVYQIGNPKFAANILPIDYTTGVNIPPRILILEKADKTGTNIIYQLPSSIFAPFDNNAELAQHTHDLDKNYEILFRGVTQV